MGKRKIFKSFHDYGNSLIWVEEGEGGGYPVHHRPFSIMSGLYPPNASSIASPPDM